VISGGVVLLMGIVQVGADGQEVDRFVVTKDRVTIVGAAASR
jgi:hypothetical protein